MPQGGVVGGLDILCSVTFEGLEKNVTIVERFLFYICKLLGYMWKFFTVKFPKLSNDYDYM